MIQSNTLRIGNMVSYNGNIETIWELRERHCYVINKMTPVEYELLEPIQITEDVLVRMGFLKLDNEYAFGNFFVYKEREKFMSGITELESVSHLQNLQFFIQGKELTLKDL